MASIGIFRVNEDELTLDPEERTYYQQALYDTETGEWSDESDPSFVRMAPEEKTVEAFADTFATARTVAADPEEIPGEIVVSSAPEETVDSAWK